MSPDTPAASHPFSNRTADYGVAEGLGIVLAAEDAGTPNPLAQWLARNPELAADLARFLAGPNVFSPPPALTEPRPGAAVGALELKEEIGRGGMGVVYRAFDPVLKRDVAVKVLRAGGELSGRELARFRFEAEAVASLDHPNVVRILATGEAGGSPYQVMPLMTGGSLAAWLKGLGPARRLAPKRAAALVRDVALGVHHAHQRALIHRDLKPGNVLLDDAGRPHVADFGLARRLDASDASTAGVAGTVAYMAPEQARGEKHLTTAIDVHALGAILFELLTGERPYGDDAVRVLRRLTDDAESVPRVHAARPDAPTDLDAICSRCLARRPEDRYPTARAVADALDRFLNDEPQTDAPRSGWGTGVFRALEWRRDTPTMRSWWSPVVGAVSTLVALMGFQAAVLLDAPTWVLAAVLAYYLCAWAAIVEWMKASARGVLTSVERTSAALQYGMMAACAALVPAYLWLPDGGAAAVIQPFAAVVGLGIFAHGVTYWGRLYVAGLLLIAFAACLPLVPTRFWPGAYALSNTTFQLWAALHLFRVHRAAEAARAG
jgi:hypothetical protein